MNRRTIGPVVIILALVLGLIFFGFNLHSTSAASCVNPSPIPSGYAAPCPVLSLSSYSITSSGPLSLTLTPNASPQYLWGTAYFYNGSSWVPLVISSNYLTATTNYTIPAGDLSSLAQGTYYLASWDWTWNQQQSCYTGPGSTTCNTGDWRVQEFAVTSGGGNQIYSITNQQPTTLEFLPGSIWTTPLPTTGAFAVGSHLLTSSDAVIKNIYENSDNPPGAIPTCISSTPGGDSCASKKSFYYASQSDPIYKVVSAAHVPPQAANDPVGKYFHLTNQAEYSSNVTDQELIVWDQSTDIDPTPGGRIFADYEFCGNGTCPRSLANCTCTTKSCADTTPSCQIAGNYTDYDYPLNDPLKGIQDGIAWSNINSGDGSMFQRMAEIQNNQIDHAILVSVACVAGGVSFPSNSDAYLCSNKTNAIHTGALVWIDSSYNCSALALWQQPFCKALQTYGGYVGPTSGGTYAGLFDNAIEGPIAEYQAGGFTPPYTFFSFLNQYSGTPTSPVYCTGSPTTRCNIYPLVGMPGLITGDAANGFVPHLHVVDPCVPREMAGQSATCTGSWQD